MKKILSFILAAILMAVPMCVQANAEGEVNYDDLVAPCFTYLNSVSSGISESALGFVTCTSAAICLDSGLTIELTCELQRTDGTQAWVAYKSKTETFTNTSGGAYVIEKNWFAPANYAYRVKTTVVVKNSSGKVLESATLNSNVLYK